MRLAAMVGILTLAANSALPVEIEEQALTVYLDNRSNAPLPVVGYAQIAAGKVFGSIGVRIQWRTGEPRADELSAEQPIVMAITDKTPPDYYPGRFAFGRPFEGVHLQILYDRLIWAESWPKLAPMLLAHVMVHEITHLVQGINRHSRTGIMKAHLTKDDFVAIEQGLLRFEADDIQLIHTGLASRASRLGRAQGQR